MPSPKDARNTSTRKSAESQGVSLGQSLLRRRSQDFKSKIAGWDVAGAGEAEEEDEPLAIVRRRGSIPTSEEGAGDDKQDITAATPRGASGRKVSTPRTGPTRRPSATADTPLAQIISVAKADRRLDAEKKAWVRRRSKPQSQSSPDLLQGATFGSPGPEVKEPTPIAKTKEPSAKQSSPLITPKKRLVSDGHWRKDRKPKDNEGSPAPDHGEGNEVTPEKANNSPRKTSPTTAKAKGKETTAAKIKTPEEPTSPKPKIVRRSVVSVGLKVPPSIQDFANDTEQRPMRIRPLRRRSRSQPELDIADIADREKTPDYESSGVKVYIKSRRKSRGAARDSGERRAFNTSESSLTVPSSVDPNRSLTDITTPDITVEHEQRRTPRTPRHREDTPRLQQHDHDKPPPRPVPKVYESRIQGWLAEMPDDPFVESTDATPSDGPAAVRDLRKVYEPVDYSQAQTRERSGRSDRTAKPDPWSHNLQPKITAARSHDRLMPGSEKVSTSDKPSFGPSVPHRKSSAGALRTAGDTGLTDSLSYVSGQQPAVHLADRTVPTTGHQLSTIESMPTVRSAGRAGDVPRMPGAPNRNIIPAAESALSHVSDGDEPSRNPGGLKRRTTKHDDLVSVLSLSRENEHSMPGRRNTQSNRYSKDPANVGRLMNEVSSDELKYQRELRTLVDGVIPVLLQYVVSQGSSAAIQGKEDTALTQPIIDIGVVLERLKSSHKRIPMHDPRELTTWATHTAKVYSDYVKVWRLGFSNVVVNLAPAQRSERPGWDDGLNKTQHGDLTDGDGERVDVAYLLKRPLVRLRNFGKTFKSIQQLQPSILAEHTVTVYNELIAQARQRHNDEHARLEDEAAASIDPSRAREIQSLTPLAGVSIDPTRHVRARDFFDMEFFHSTGQQLGCRVELIIRDDAPERGSAVDLLICEVSPDGRWLLFPPVLADRVSARRGDKDGELIIMVRGSVRDTADWRELMSLQGTEEQSLEWIDMLGSNPIPPKLNRRSSYNVLRPSNLREAALSAADADAPIGARAHGTAPQWDGSDVNSVSGDAYPLGPHRPASISLHDAIANAIGRDGAGPNQEQQQVRDNNNSGQPGTLGLARSHIRSRSDWTQPTRGRSVSRDYIPGGPCQTIVEENMPNPGQSVKRPALRKRTSSVPLMDDLTVDKSRQVIGLELGNDTSQDKRVASMPLATTQEPMSAPAKLQKRLPPAPQSNDMDRPATADTPTTPIKAGAQAIPSFTPAFMQQHRRTSSPLKHEYEPSTASESPSGSEYSDQDDGESITSESDDDCAVSVLGELKDFNRHGPVRPTARSRPLPPAPSSTADVTLGPSESASRSPSRVALGPNASSAKTVACLFAWADRGSWDSVHPEECQIVVTPGLIEAFDLAQAHTAATNSRDHASSPSALGVRPLVAFELTPWVPLRRGTAVDISLRSPPTSDSVLRNSSNIMFRSRSPEECEKLYNLINRARIENPTWIAMQEARGPAKTSNWAEVMDRRNAERQDADNASWLKSLSRKGSTYRSKGTRTASVAGTQSSSGALNGTFSALRQFSGSSRIFNITKSTIMSKQSTRSSYSDSLSSGRATPCPIDPNLGAPIGVSNTKIKLYIRESTTKWRDLGNARLTIVLPPRKDPTLPADPRATGLEKRVLIYDKNGSMLLDVTLGEHCFERVARTGIAVSVWEEGVGTNGEVRIAATGGVNSSKSVVYMLQMKSERDAAFTFSMVGKLRY